MLFVVMFQLWTSIRWRLSTANVWVQPPPTCDLPLSARISMFLLALWPQRLVHSHQRDVVVTFNVHILNTFTDWCLDELVNVTGILTLWVLDKMAAVLQTTFSNSFNLPRKCIYLDSNLIKICYKDPVVNKSGLIQVMVWHLVGTLPLPEPILTKMSDAIGCQSATMG